MSRADELYAEYIRRKKEDEKSSSTHALPSTTAPKSTTVNSLAFTAQPTGPSLSELQSEFGAVAAQNPNKIVKTDPLVSNRYSKGVDAFIPNISTTPEQQRKNQKTLQNVQKSLTSSNELLNKNLQEKSDTYSQKVNEIIKSNKDDDVKNNLAYEEQLKYEINTLQIALNRQKRQAQGLDTNKPFYTSEEVRTAKINQNLNNLGGNSRYSLNQSEEQKTANDTAALLAEKSAQLKAVQEINAPYHVMDNPELSKDLQTMYANRKDPKAVETYGKNIKAAGYDPQKILDWYTTQKNEEILKNPTAVALLNEIYAYNTRATSEYDDEYDDSYIEKVMKEKSGYKAPHIVAMEARGKLANMGYDVDELYSYYSAKLNQEGTEALLSPVKSFAKEHPVLGAAASIALTPLTSIGGIGAVARSVASGTPVDPNDPSLIFANTKSTIDSTAVSNANTFDGLVYKAATTLGSMLVNKGVSLAVGGGPAGYALLSAMQAVTSSVQEDSQKGYSVEQIAANALVSGAITYAASSFGFEKVFSSKTAYEQGLKKAFITAGLSEAGEEITEDSVNIAVKNISNYVFNHETEIKADAQKYMSMGYSEDEAYTKVWSDIALQLAETGAISFITGSASNVVSNSPEYLDGIARLVGRQINIDLDSTAGRDAFDKLNTNIGTATTDADSELNNAPEGVESTPFQTAPDNTENADTQANSEDTEYVTETVGDDGTVYFDFDDDFDTEPLKNLNDRQAQQTAKTIEDNRAVMHDPEATAEERNTAQSNIIKAEYEAETYEGITGEQTEAYTSGNAAVDALVNTNGRLDRKITINEQAEQKLVDMAEKWFNRKIRFVDTLNGKNGRYVKETGEIEIARDSDKKYVTVFGHEFLHSLEGTHGYDTLTTFLKYNSPYIKNKVADFGSWEALVNDKIDEYRLIGVELTQPEAEYEIYADAVADEFFSDYKTMESLATQNRSLFTKLKQWFYTNVIKITDQTRVYGKNAAARKTYALMLRAEKAAMSQSNNNENTIKYSVNSKYQTLLDNWDGKTTGFSFLLGTTSKALQEAGIPDRQIKIDATKLKTALSKHNGMTIDIFKQLPDMLENPIVVLDSKRDENSRIVIGDLYDEHGKPVTAVLFLNPTSRKGNALDLIKVSSAEGRSHIRSLFFKEDGTNVAVRYADKNRAQEWLNANRLQLPLHSTTLDSNNSISDSAENVNGNISYSAKKPEIIDKLKADYGYSEASANNIYRAARTLKQNTGSKADIEQLTTEIVTSLENRRNGEIDSDNINRIAMMLAENAEAVNETYVSEYKPIMDYLKGTKISISETDISDLGDAFSYVKKRLFPTVTLAKEGGTPVDTVFQELSAKFPNTFNADEITHPADQVKAISGFIEEYRDNYYFKPYFEGDEAYTQLRDSVYELVNDKLIDNSTYLKRLTEMTNTYGELKNGIPQSTDGETRVRRGAASIYGTEAVQKIPERVERFVRDFVNGKHDYQILRIGKEAKAYVDNIKASDNVAETIMSEYSRLRRKLTSNERLRPIDIVQAHALNPLLGDILSDDDYVEFTMLTSEVGTESGQITSSFRLISQFSGTQKLKAYHNKLDQINAKRAKNYQGEPDANAVADENGQFKITDESLSESKSPKNKTPKGFIELAVAKKQSKYPPIEIPARLEAELAKAKSQAEIDAATDKINKYLAEQIHPTWFERFDAWQYFSMLSNPKTAVRNVTGNVAMGATSRMKDIVAAALSASPLAKKYKDSSVQTSAVKTTKEARKAATAIITGSDMLFDLYSGQDKYTGRVNEFEQGEAKLNILEKKIAERNPLLDTIFHKRSIQPTAMASTGRAIIDKPLTKLSDIQQKMLDDTLFKVLRSKSVLAQSITTAVKKGDIENIDDFLAVALNGNTEHLDNATKIRYAQLFDTIVNQAAKEGDEATFRDDNKFADALNKFEKNLEKNKAMPVRLLSIVVKSLVRFKKTPANIVKRGYEYSPIALGINLINGRVKLAKGEIDRNAYINEIAKGLTGTLIFGLGALLSRVGLLNVGDEDEEDEAERKLLSEQNYSLNVGDGTYTIDFLSPAALPLFMGGKVYETVVSVLDGDEIKATEFMFDILQGVAEPMFAQTMLDGIDGAFEAISMNSAYDDTAGASFMALMNYCAESWVQQFVPAFLGGIARTADDTVRGYYNEPGKDEGLLDTLMVGIKKKLPGKTDETPAKLDMWGQPMSSGSLGERLIENFISPGYHQYFAVKKAVERAKVATVTDGKGGVFWHTQGSGKSLSMVFYAHLLQEALDSPTIVVMTDRIDLDDQLYSEFSKCADFLRQTPVQAESKVHLKELLAGRQANGIIFTTMFKFEESEEPLSTRRNIVVMADEAHRGQYGMDERVVMTENEQGEAEARIVVGNARIIRDALPNATFIGFTGTPVSSKDRNTREVFGEYIDIYDMTQAVEDGATRPVYYESRVIHLKLDENTLKLIDSTYDVLEQQADSVTIEKSKKMLGQMESVLGADSTIESLVDDIVKHYENGRANLLTGKAMIVAYSRPIAMKIYRRLMEVRPDWKEKVGVVMTSGNNDPEDWKEIIGTKHHKEELARKFKDNNDPMKIAIVVDMWLTGFDVPSMATMYVYKPMHGYNLMQAIARVNRVFKDKEGGLVVDYVGIASALKSAMNEYTARDRSRYGDMDIAKTAYPKFQEKLQVCRDLFHGFDYSGFIKGSALEMAQAIKNGVNFVLDVKVPERKDLYLKEALLMRQAMSLCSSMTTDKERREQAYFEAVRSGVIKLIYGGTSGRPLSLKEINAQINELLKASIQSEGVINLFDSKTVGENFSLFDPNILEEISKMKEKNIAVEILRKLMAEQISLYKRTNVVKSEKFSEKIAKLMNAYYNGLITNEEVIKELLEAAQEIANLHKEGEKLGLTTEELAFYDALTKPQAIKDFYENDVLVEMTRELTEMLRKNRTIDWQKKETARAGMRKMVKRLLKKYKYPPEGMDDAVQTVMSQCELWTDNMEV